MLFHQKINKNGDKTHVNLILVYVVFEYNPFNSPFSLIYSSYAKPQKLSNTLERNQ